MAKASEQPLEPNPFRTYRDPKTGLWVVLPISETESHFPTSVTEKNSPDSKEVL
ncbi:hypothetical protein [Crocosphaera sp. Alani8]|uniref:hypothetical protein n=1 Tax=Crocosphaera sp. Alani8 TaxID=3038952 RepID=UPI00313E814C